MRWFRSLAAALLSALAATAPGAGAENASATLLPGDRLHGDILAAGDDDRLLCWLPEGTLFSADLLPDPESSLVPALEVRDPLDKVMDLAPYTVPAPGGVGVRVRNVSGGATGGTFTFLVTGTGGSTGKYGFRLTARMPKRPFGTLTLGTGEEKDFGFDAPAGTRMSYSIQPPAGSDPSSFSATLHAPDDSVTPLDGLSGGRIPLDQDGPWALYVSNGGAASATLVVVVHLALPKPSRRVLYLSPDGFGPAPRVKSLSPRKVLDDRPAPGIVVTGEGFDPAAVIRLEKPGQAPLAPTGFSISGSGTATADFDVTGVAKGGWKLVVENPSGGAGRGTLVVQAAGSVKLPAGLKTETEAWWLDFDGPAFRSDLAALGLGSANPDVQALAEAAVKSYAIYWLRVAFRLDPRTGKVVEGTSVPVSFCLTPPPYTVGAVGTEYDRLAVGGAAAGGDPSSNPNYAWGDGPLDAGNPSCDDVSEAGGTGRGVKTAALVAPGSGPYHDALQPLKAVPLAAGDAKYFFADFLPASAAEGLRYRDIAVAVNAAGREIAGTIAHFVARAMGTADGGSGLASVPAAPGTYAALPVFGFLQAEIDALKATGLARPGLPGKMKTLKANWFPYREGSGYRLPDATSTQAYVYSFVIAGGRPDRVDGDLQFTGVAGTVPLGFQLLATGGVSGTAPLRNPDSTLDGGVFRFLVKLRDKVSGDTLYFSHRLNLLVDTTDPTLSPAEKVYGNQKNSLTLSTPD
jgi:hypothetical protein